MFTLTSSRKSETVEILELALMRPYSFLEARARRNTRYMIDGLADRQDVAELLSDLEGFRDYLKEALDKAGHTYRVEGSDYKEDLSGINSLSARQLVRVHLLLESLGGRAFRHEIGCLLEKDLEDPYSEHGGLVMLEERVKLMPVESALSKKPENNGSYLLPGEARDIPNLGYYHQHATTPDDSEYAGPSGGLFVAAGDLAAAEREAVFHGESHNLVITKLDGEEFNVDFYGTEGDGMVVIDLGNYTRGGGKCS